MDSRNRTLNMLLEADSGSFSNETMRAFQKEDWDVRDRVFITRLFYGVLEKRIWLDFVIDLFANTKAVKMKPVIRNIIRMGLYQMAFMDSVPERAAIDESVKLAKKRGFSQLGGFVNGTLRTIQREELPRIPNWVEHSVPQWIYKKLVFDFSADFAERYLDYLDTRDPRVSIVTIKPQARMTLEAEGCSLTEIDGKIGCYRLSGFDRITDLKAYRDGMFYVQDVNSVRVAMDGIRQAKNAELILDVCAAPGGKSIIAAREFPKARIISRDISEEKVSVIRANASRLGLKNIECEVFNALDFDEKLAGRVDLVIADLPCSGLGVMGRKPDIKYRVNPEDIETLAALQRDILKASVKYLKKGGILSYSTCTFTKEENLSNAQWAREELGLEILKSSQYLPSEGDCFGVTVFKKRDI